MAEYGTLNERKRGRDIVPDVYKRLHYALITFIFIWNIGVFFLAKDRAIKPTLSVWSPTKVGLFQIALDYCTSQSSFAPVSSCIVMQCLTMLPFHSLLLLPPLNARNRCPLGHPPPALCYRIAHALLVSLGSSYQDIIEWLLTPLFAFLVVKLTFAELYVASRHTLYIEAFGHLEIRAYWPHPILAKVLKPFGMELAVENHELHHRSGRGGKNYGKQTRIWDVLFGTCAPREEEDIYAAAKGQ